MRYTRWLWLVIFPLALALSVGQIDTPLGGEAAARAAAPANGGAWQQVNTPSSPGNLMGHSLVTINNDVYLFGGVASGDPNPQDDVWEYHALANNWSMVLAVGPAPPGRFHHAAAATPDGQLVIHGGTDGTNILDDLWIYDPILNTWVQKTPPGPKPPALMDHRAVVANGQVHLVGA